MASVYCAEIKDVVFKKMQKLTCEEFLVLNFFSKCSGQFLRLDISHAKFF